MTEQNPVVELTHQAARLAALMIREVEVLRSPTPSQVAAMQEEKATLADAFVALFQQVRAERRVLDAAPAAERAALKAAFLELKEASEKNLRALRVAKTFNERLMKAVSDAVIDQRSRLSPYSAGGAAPASRDAQPLALNDSI